KGFSAFCKRADPLQIQRILRDYLTAMTLILRSYGGTLDKYMGDGIMAFFGDAEAEGGGEEAEEKRVERNAANAVRAGLAMQKKTQQQTKQKKIRRRKRLMKSKRKQRPTMRQTTCARRGQSGKSRTRRGARPSRTKTSGKLGARSRSP